MLTAPASQSCAGRVKIHLNAGTYKSSMIISYQSFLLPSGSDSLLMMPLALKLPLPFWSHNTLYVFTVKHSLLWSMGIRGPVYLPLCSWGRDQVLAISIPGPSVNTAITSPAQLQSLWVSCTLNSNQENLRSSWLPGH